MDIKTKLMNKFSEIVDVYYETINEDNFLRVKTNLITLKAIEVLTHKVSDYLDQVDYNNSQYYLDIFSVGATNISDEELKKLDEN